MKAEILEEVKKEMQKMLDAEFIKPCRYAEWISSVVPVKKKDGRWRVCVDFRDLNRATPKDEYPMPVAETLISQSTVNSVFFSHQTSTSHRPSVSQQYFFLITNQRQSAQQTE